MRESIEWFNRSLAVAIQLYFRQECEYGRLEEVHPPRNGWMEGVNEVMKRMIRKYLKPQSQENGVKRVVIRPDSSFFDKLVGLSERREK